MQRNKSKKVEWAKNLISSTTDSVKDTSYDEVVDYLEYIVKKYDTILHNITGKKINDILKILEICETLQCNTIFLLSSGYINNYLLLRKISIPQFIVRTITLDILIITCLDIFILLFNQNLTYLLNLFCTI